MELRRGHVDLGEQGAFEPCKWETQFKSFKDGGMKKEEGVLCIHGVVITYGFTLPTRHDPHKTVVLLPEDTRLVFVAFAIFVGLEVFNGVCFGCLSQKGFRGPGVKSFVVDRGWRVQSCFGSSHLEKN